MIGQLKIKYKLTLNLMMIYYWLYIHNFIDNINAKKIDLRMEEFYLNYLLNSLAK